MNVGIDYTNLDGWSIGSEMMDWILINIKKESTILEFGAGKGAIELAKQYKVISIEHDPEWINLTKKAEYHLVSIIDGWYDRRAVAKAIHGKRIDVVIVDGPPGTGNRDGLFSFIKNTPSLTKSIFIVNDVHREKEKMLAEKIANLLKRKLTFFKTEEKSFCVL
jgi:precorrin-6B methylase 2